MIRTKQQADLHVIDTLKRIKTKQERLLRGYQFAKIYVDIKEYDKAKEYLLGFLSVKDNSAPGHKLLGQILEVQHHLSEAAAAYAKSLSVDKQQKDVLLKICELYSQLNISPDLAKIWAEKGEQMFPTNDAIFKLKMKAHSANGESNNPEELISFLAAESAKCPSDPVRRVKLLRSLMDLDRINEAYTAIVEVEMKDLYPESLDWYRCIVNIYRDYKQTTGSNINGKFHQQLLSATNRLTALSIEQSLTIVEAVGSLWSLDQELMRQNRGIASASEDWRVLYQEVEAQYLFHCGTLLLNKAQKERLSWREASDLAYACFQVSHSVPVINREAPWYAKASADERAVYDRWYHDSCFRSSQTGHMLMQKFQSSDGGQKWIERIQDECCHQAGRDRIFHILFTQPQQKNGQEESYLSQCLLFTNNLLVPDRSLLMEWDIVVQRNKPDNLQLLVWTCLHYYSVGDKTQPKYPFALFERLPFGTQNLDTATPETLNQLDVLAFLYATVRNAALRHSSRCCNRHDPYQPNLLPLPISEKLCSDSQREWWTSAYKLHVSSVRESLSKMRAILQRGLETIRIVGTNLGMDVDLVVHLARTFTEQLEELKSQLDSMQELDLNMPFLRDRAVHYWNKAVELLEKLEKKRPLPMQRNPMFESHNTSLDVKQLSAYLDEGRLFQAVEAKGEGRYTEAIRLLSHIKTADAAFQSALLHKELAIADQGMSQNESTTQDRGHSVALLTRAKSDLYETLDRLKGDKYHILNGRVAEEIDDVETRLLRMEGLRGNSFDEEAEERIENVSGVEKIELLKYRRPERVIHSTPQVQRSLLSELDYSQSETRLRPSPDRLDAQIRSLTHGQDQWLKIIMDEMKDNRTTIQKLQERVTLLESKLQDVQEQLKQSQTAALATAVAASHPPLAPAQPTGAIMYQPSPFRGEGYDYWGSHIFDPALHSSLYRGYQQPVAAGYGVGYTGLVPKSVQQPPNYPPPSRIDMEDYGSENYAYGEEYCRDGDYSVRQEAVKGETISSSSSGFGPVPALQPGFFSVLKPLTDENALTSPTVGTREKSTKPAGERVPVAVILEGHNIRFSTSDSVVTIPRKPGVLQTSASSTERVLPATSELLGDKSDGKTIPASSSTSAIKQLLSQSSESQGEDGSLEDSNVEPHFEPIVNLPEVVDLKTGEEDEMVMFSDRVKLFRFADKQWKERGVGILKVLFNEKTVRARILMRREQVHKVCANHNIKPGMAVEKKSPGEGKILTWKAVDCSDEEPRLEQFCCKFKTEASASEFIENVNKAIQLIDTGLQENKAKDLVFPSSRPNSTSSLSYASSVQSPASASIAVTTSLSQKFALAPQNSSSSVIIRPPCLVVTATPTQHPEKLIFAVPSTNMATGSKFGSSFTAGSISGEQPSAFSNTSTATNMNTPVGKPSLFFPAPVAASGAFPLVPSTKADTLNTQQSLFASTFASASTLLPVANVFPATFGASKDASGAQPSIVTASVSTSKISASGLQAPHGSASLTISEALSSGVLPVLFAPAFSTSKASTTGAQTSLFGALSASKESMASVAVTAVVSAFSSASSASSSPASLPGSTTTIGGFTFCKPPVFKAEEKKGMQENKNAPKPANPFANFSFVLPAKSDGAVTKESDGKTSSISGGGFNSLQPTITWASAGQGTLAQILRAEKTDKETKPDNLAKSSTVSVAPVPIFGQSTSIAELSFGTVAASGAKSLAFQVKKGDVDIFKDKGQRLFEGIKSTERETEDGNDEAEDYVPDRSFEALVSLPEVEVVTGEENEMKLFGERAKLYRMDNDSKQWKERGVGEIKILQNTLNQKFRILMRREQVLKVCANHYITHKMKLLPMKASENAWCWYAKDFSEEEYREEQLAVKFKTAEQAENFRKSFEDCQHKLTNPDKVKATKENSNASIDQNKKVESTSLSSLFKCKEGDWQCETCYVKNNAERTKCIACETAKAKAKPSQPVVENVGPLSSSESLSSLFKPKEGEWKCDACYVKNEVGKTKCVACETPKPGAPEKKEDSDGVKPSVQLKFGPSGGFMLNSGQPISFGSGFGSSTVTSDSSKAVGTGFIPSGTGFGTVSSGFGGFTFGNTKVVAGVAKDSSSAPNDLSMSSASQPSAEGFGKSSSSTKASESSGEQVSESTAKSQSVPITVIENRAMPIFGISSTPVAPSSTSSVKSTFTFGGTTGTDSSAAFTFSGKGFSLGTFGTPNTADSQQKEDSHTGQTLSSVQAPTSSDKTNSGFSFTAGPSSSPAVPATSSIGSSRKIFGTSSFMFSGLSVKDTATTEKLSGLTTPTKPNSAVSPASPQSPDGGLYRNSEGEDDHIVFEPIVKLPENFETRTGEEEEDVLYSQRAKLYRYVGNEWRERGLGDVKILQHKGSKQVRLLMRREKVLKICMNHRLVPEMSLKPMLNTEGKAWTWHAEDFADGECVHEKFSIRFKDTQIASEFEDAFNRAMQHVKSMRQDAKRSEPESMQRAILMDSFSKHTVSSPITRESMLLGLLTVPSTSNLPSSSVNECEVVSVKEPSIPLVEKAKHLQLPKYFYNYLDAPGCPGCCGCDSDSFDFSKIGQRPSDGGTSSTSASFVFGGLTEKMDPLKTDAASAKKPAQVPADPVSVMPGFVFGGGSRNRLDFACIAPQQLSVQKPAEEKLPAASQPFIFGSVGRGLDFASVAESSGTNNFASTFTQSKSDPNFRWEGAGSTLFGSGGAKMKATKRNEAEEEDEEAGSGTENQDEESCGITFTPVVQLPEVEVKTGEEDEDEMFRERAKLYRFDSSQWKERGVGDMKILKHKVNGTYRLLLRREQVHKVACNHLLAPDMKLQPQRTSDATWCWFAQDFSEGEARMEQFALKFKTKALADAFKAKFEECQTELSSRAQFSAVATIPPCDSQPREQSDQKVPANVAPSENSAGGVGDHGNMTKSSESSSEDEDDEIPSLFSKRATVRYMTSDQIWHEGGLVDIMAIEDEDDHSIRLQMFTDQGEVICNHIIDDNHELKRLSKKNSCEWTAKDFSNKDPVEKTFQVMFSSQAAVQEFETIFKRVMQK